MNILGQIKKVPKYFHEIVFCKMSKFKSCPFPIGINIPVKFCTFNFSNCFTNSLLVKCFAIAASIHP